MQKVCHHSAKRVVSLFRIVVLLTVNACPRNPGPRVRNYGTGGGYLQVIGSVKLKVIHKDMPFLLDFVVADES